LTDPKELIEASINATRSLIPQAETLVEAAKLMTDCVKQDGTVYFFGNGGSAADAQHLAAEMIGRFRKDRAPIRAAALNANTSILSAVSNDYGFETVFERQVKAHARRGDVVVGISTSGTSENVVRALSAARDLGCTTVLLTGAGWADTVAEETKAQADVTIVVDSKDTARIQEGHILAGHVICCLVEEKLFGASPE
jgi:D-sedoheptulose 7-phosphate isomerase